MDKKLKTTAKSRGDDGYRVTSIRLVEETVSEIESISKKTGRSRNEIINMLLRYALQNYEIIAEE